MINVLMAIMDILFAGVSLHKVLLCDLSNSFKHFSRHGSLSTKEGPFCQMTLTARGGCFLKVGD